MNVLVLDENLNQISVITNFVELSFTRKYNKFGYFSITVNMNQKNADTLDIGRVIYLDPQRSGVINHIEINRRGNKSTEVITASGRELKDAIYQRSTIAPSGLANDEYIDVIPENIIRSLIDKHIVNPTDANRKIDIFKLGAANGLGKAINYQTANENLAEEIYFRLLVLDDIGFKCEVDLSAKSAELSVYQGLDRSISQSVNPHAMFSINLGTSISNQVVKDYTAMTNFVYAGDNQTGISKTIVPVFSEAQEPAGINRFERVKIVGNTLTNDDLETLGLAEIKTFGKALQVSGATSVGEPEYDLGDKITYIDYKTNEKADLRIVTIYYYYEGSQPVSRKLVFGNDSINIAQALSSKYGQIVKEFIK